MNLTRIASRPTPSLAMLNSLQTPPPSMRAKSGPVDAFEAPVRARTSLVVPAPAKDPRRQLAINAIKAQQTSSSDDATDGKLLGANGQSYPASTPLSQIPAVKPNNGKTPTGETVVFINGMGSNAGDAEGECQQIANRTGESVINLHNSTDGFLSDLGQSMGDFFGAGKNAAVDSLTQIVYQHLKDGEPLHLVGHSQGGLIISRALTNAKLLLQKDGMSAAQATAAMGNLKVETYAGAAPSYPDGPKYVHYIDDADPVAWLGLDHPGTHPGAGATIEHFNTGFNLFDPFRAHALSNYLNHWVPFDQAAHIQKPALVA
jgi:pimeloyl-ACP methyl ester carboxylesterase